MSVQDPQVYVGPDGRPRCRWTQSARELISYHDTEWGYPVADDIRLFEKMSLESFQSGLSWLTILKKRDAFREAFAGFDFELVSGFGSRDVERLLNNASIVRHRGKIEATIHNAEVARNIADRYGSLAAYVWQFEPDASERPQAFTWDVLKTLSTSPASQALSKDLKKRGWKFFGPTTAYAFMQAMGLVNDHQDACYRRGQIERTRATFVHPN